MEIFQANVFFVISSLAVIAVTVSIVFVSIQFFRVLKRVDYFFGLISSESEKFVGDIEALRTSVRSEGSRIKAVVSFIFDKFRKRRSSKSRK